MAFPTIVHFRFTHRGTFVKLTQLALIGSLQLERSVHRFTNFYSGQHSGRKLNWLYNMSKGELHTNCFKNRYTLQASTFQMAVLLQFNVAESWTISQLEENTQIKTDFLIQVIQILLKAKLITCEDDENDLSPNSVVNLFLGYKK